MSSNQLIIELNQQPIELCKLLKVTDMVSGGGEAKIVISTGYVLVNGEVEYQKRKKIFHGDIIEYNGDILQVMVNENLALNQSQDNSLGAINKPPATEKQTESLQNSPPSSEFNTDNALNTKGVGPRKRRPISF